jgi:drug/metabolite transporter (DMT)-like permease
MTTPERRRSPHIVGAILVLVSAAVFSTAGIFTKGIHARAWDIIFWRGLFAALFTTAYTLWRGAFRTEFAGMGRSGWAAALVGASGSAAFIPAFKLTSIANVSLIYAATPLLAALLAWAWIGERPTARVMVGSLVAIIGVAVIVSGSLGGIHLQGDFLAAWMACAMAILFVIYRRHPSTPAAGPSVLSSLVLLPFAYALGTPLGDLPSEITIMAGFGLIFALASVTLAEGAKRISAGETGLLSALEVVFAPLLGWLVFAELPAAATVAGGLLVLAGVVWTQIHSKLKVTQA